MTENFPKLAPPGAGLPLIQHLVAKYILVPKFFRKTSWEFAQKMFDKEGRKILKLAENLNEKQMTTRILVDPIPGIEDSSRFWSIAMAMEHLVIVGELMLKAIVDLSHGTVPTVKVGTADVKPLGEIKAADAFRNFENFLKKFGNGVNQVTNRESPLTFAHPWFGELTPHKWLCMGALHQRIHRQQSEAILKSVITA